MDELLHRFNPWWATTIEFPGIVRVTQLGRLQELTSTPDVILITGLRRVGKTTLMHQLIHRLLESVEARYIFYVSMDNLALKDHSILELIEAYRSTCGIRYDEQVYLFLDEIHFKPDFELQLKNIYDMGHAKVFASGSASLDLTMKSPALTGRQRIVPIAPLSFSEYLQFTGQEPGLADRHLLPTLVERYIETGGMPEYVLTNDPNVLQALIDTLLYRDIAGRHDIRNRESLLDILLMIAQGVGNPLSKRKISRVLGLPIETVGKIIGLFVEANLIHLVERQGKVSERKASPVKMYLADTGLFTILTERINRGVMVENAVYLALRRKAPRDPLRYHLQTGKEVDLVRGSQAWEVKYKDRLEENDLANLSGLKDGDYPDKTIVTKRTEDEQEGIRRVPAWKFLLEIDEH